MFSPGARRIALIGACLLLATLAGGLAFYAGTDRGTGDAGPDVDADSVTTAPEPPAVAAPDLQDRAADPVQADGPSAAGPQPPPAIPAGDTRPTGWAPPELVSRDPALGDQAPTVVLRTEALTARRSDTATPAEAERATAAPGAELADGQFQEVLLDLQFGRLSSTTVRAYSNGLEPLLPLFAFLQLAEVDVRRDSLGAIRATLFPGARPLWVSADSFAARVGGQAVPLEAGDLLPDGEEVFVAAPVLEELLGIVIRTDWLNLTTTVMNPDVLPLGQRLAREARWDRIRAQRQGFAPAPRLDLDPGPLGGAVLDWSLSNNARAPGETLAYALGLGTRVFNGSLQVSGRSLGPISQGGDRFDFSYETVFNDAKWLTQVRLGDGFTTGPRFRDIRGFSLTNAPFLRGSAFGVDVFSGEVGPGWDIELRQSGQVLDLTRADEQGAFALDIPLRYGENALQVVAFGPHGEVVTTDRLLLLGLDRLPEGQFEWGLSGGRCRTVICRETGNLDLRYGLNDRWTLQTGIEGFTRDTGSNLLQPYAKATGMLTQELQISLEGVDRGFLRAGAIFAPSPWIRFRGAHTAFSGALDEPILHNSRRLRTSEADFFFRPDPDRPRLFLRASLLNQDLTTGDLARAQASATVPFGNLAIEGGVRREINDPRGDARFQNDFQFAALNGHVRVGNGHRFWIRGEVEVREAEIMNRLQAQIGYQINQRVRLGLTTGWQKNFGPRLALTFSAFLSELRSVVQYNEVPGGPGQVTQFSQGTVYWNEATAQVSLAPGPGLQRGGISGYVFLDDNGNGVRDDGEEGLEGVRLVVGGRPVTSDARGRHASWDLVPYQSISIWTDSASIADPTLVPVRNRVQVDVPPSSFGRVDIPISTSREITGRVIRVNGGVDGLPVPYADLELENLETGQIHTFRTFSDGEFYEAGIRPGEYEVRVAQEYMEQASLVVDQRWPTLTVEPGASFQVVGPVTLRVIRLNGPGDEDNWIEADPERTEETDANSRNNREWVTGSGSGEDGGGS